MEILITVIVLAIGLLGLAGLQLNGLRSNHNAYLASQATILTNDIIDRMLINKTSLNLYTINIGEKPAATSCEGVACGVAQLAKADKYEWKDTLENSLPSGDGSIAINGSLATIIVQWDDSKGQNDPLQLITEVKFQD